MRGHRIIQALVGTAVAGTLLVGTPQVTQAEAQPDTVSAAEQHMLDLAAAARAELDQPPPSLTELLAAAPRPDNVTVPPGWHRNGSTWRDGTITCASIPGFAADLRQDWQIISRASFKDRVLREQVSLSPTNVPAPAVILRTKVWANDGPGWTVSPDYYQSGVFTSPPGTPSRKVGAKAIVYVDPNYANPDDEPVRCTGLLTERR